MPNPCPLPNPSPTTRSSINLAVSRVINFCLSLIEATELDKSNQNYLHINTIPLFFKRRGGRGNGDVRSIFITMHLCNLSSNDICSSVLAETGLSKNDRGFPGREQNCFWIQEIFRWSNCYIIIFFGKLKTPLKANPLFWILKHNFI